MTPEQLLAAARDLVTRPDAATSGVWPRTAALLTRQALEHAVASLWERDPRTARLARCSMRSQLTCLPGYLGADAAARTGYAWSALSAACHYHPYELAPTAVELTRWLGEAAALVALLASRAPAPGVAPRDPVPAAPGESQARM